MHEYSTEFYDLVKNLNGCAFYKLFVDGKCRYDDFVMEIEKLPRQKKGLVKVLALMERYSPYILLPKEKFRQIENVKRKDVFEFKDVPSGIRVFVVLQKPNIYIVDGSVKNEQKRTINSLTNLLKGFKQEEA